MDKRFRASEPLRFDETSSVLTATLSEVDISDDLASRNHRTPDYEAEHRAIATLSNEMAENPRNLLQKVAETAVDLCNAGSAGISLLEGDVFRWEALAGVFGSYRYSTMPRYASPCGICIDKNTTRLMTLPDRHFPAIRTDPRFVEALLIPFHARGKPVGTVWIVTHDSERKFDREDERIVRTLAAFASSGWQLWTAYEEAALSSQSKDQFAAMLGHELRSPLAAIVNANDTLQKMESENPKSRQAIDVIGRQAQHLSRMVDDIVDMSRISRGNLDLQKEMVELRAIVENAAETSRPQIEHRRHILSITLPNEPIFLNGDLVRLVQMLSNLLNNAAKYTPEGGDISLSAVLESDEVCISVRDTGIGIPKDRLDSVFGLFAQLGDSSSTASSSGLGIGLYLARSIAELHGGGIDAVSAGAGKGAIFAIRLPILLTSVVDSKPTEAANQTSSSKRRRVLLVEDNSDVAESMGELLSLEGHAVHIASSGAAALAALQTFNPDVVLLDIGLPDMNGYTVARRMREKSNRPGLIIIALSGYGQDEHVRQSKAAGCDDHLVKPVDANTLRAFVDRPL